MIHSENKTPNQGLKHGKERGNIIDNKRLSHLLENFLS